ncbi:MAG: epoxyqueuosine reductase, partial [Candidatus Bathyarchaeota archaeon]
MNDLTSQVRNFALREGADLVGIAPVARFREAPVGRKPEDLLPNAQSVVVLAKRIPKGIVETIPSPYYQKIGYVDLNLLLSTLAYNVARFLEEHGYNALPVMSSIAPQFRYHEIIQEKPEPKVKIWGDFSHRHAAVEAGLGEIGANSLFISPKFGPRVRLTSIISTAPLKPDIKLSEKVCVPKECGLICVKTCPAKALKGDGSVD